ncbi:hypothetical protein EV683_12813 [Crenobacter luteus]|uniref:Co-chaperone DjlA N-terminal domain-containing protein n=1 Tax=Crenobacter luteus TaxID=1452487 RepID=A0A161SBM8_9NEIS|nr:TerB family tellurite resistance protein [Crenobacter luteus]KZE27342.1 hypothetical protein AVW16_01990 [Crenobacter luteus]TCP09384.1 hypothetical protein EV683_12813 [Crenobacter luteus]
MKTYSPNSPEALARLLAMFMITDGNMDPREIESLENLHIYEILGLSRKQFIQILVDYCDDISDEADGDGTIHLIDKSRLDSLLDDITERKQRILAAALAIDVCKSDGTISEAEMALLRYMLDAWQITLDDIENEFVKP